MIRFFSRALHIFFGFGGTCRYVPTCSQYSSQAFDQYGILKGSLLTLCRLCRCHPLGGNGLDPVPEKLGKATHK